MSMLFKLLFKLLLLLLFLCDCNGITGVLDDYVKRFDYGILIDCGSSGSRVYVYRWKIRTFHTVYPDVTYPVQQQGATLKLVPGISTMFNDTTKIANHFRKLVDFALKNLNKVGVSSYHDVPIYVYATAGMRVLPFQQRDSIMNDVRTFIKLNYNFLYTNNDWARIISGEEEGAFGFIAVNSLYNVLNNNIQSETYGVVDLGGASAEITFASTQNILESFFPLNLAYHKVDYKLYTHSYLYYGKDETIRQIREKIVANTARKNQIIDPCLPKNYNVTFFNRIDNKYYLVQGASNIQECQKNIVDILHLERPCLTAKSTECGFNGAYQAPYKQYQTFVAYSAFVYIRQFLDLRSDARVYEYKDGAEEICKMTVNDLINYNNVLPYPQPRRYIFDMCFLANYVYYLLVKGYKLSANNKVLVLDEINQNEVGWPYGAIVYETNQLAFKFSQEDNSMDTWMLAFLVTFILLSISLTLLYQVRAGEKSKTSAHWQRLNADDDDDYHHDEERGAEQKRP